MIFHKYCHYCFKNLITKYGKVSSISIPQKILLPLVCFAFFEKVWELYSFWNCWKRSNRYDSKFHIEFSHVLSKLRGIETESADRESWVAVGILMSRCRQITTHNQFSSDFWWRYCITGFYKLGSLLKSVAFCMRVFMSNTLKIWHELLENCSADFRWGT